MDTSSLNPVFATIVKDTFRKPDWMTEAGIVEEGDNK